MNSPGHHIMRATNPCSLLPLLSLWLLILASPSGAAEDAASSPPAVRRIDFARDVLPILREQCVACHGPALAMGKLRLDRAAMALRGGESGVVITPGKSAESLLVRRLVDDRLGVLMPPTGKLAQHHVETLQAWIDQGAAWPEELVVISEERLAEVPAAVKMFLAVVRTGDVALLRKMLADASLVRAADRHGATALHHAALHARTEGIQLLLERGANATDADRNGATALMWAVSDLEKTRLLLHAGSDVNARSRLGRTPLLIASSHAGNAEVVRLLLRSGANPQARDERGLTALQLAARTRDIELLKTLIEAGLDVNASRDGDDMTSTAIVEAASLDDTASVKLLLEHGARGKSLDVALVNAAVHGSTVIVQLLLAGGAQANARARGDFEPQTPLVAAAYSDYQDCGVVKLLLEHGAELSSKDVKGKVALDYARERGPSPVVELLSPESAAPTSVAATAPAVALDPAAVRQRVQRTVTLLQAAGATFTARGGGNCAACHHQSAASLAAGLARSRGLDVDEKIAREQLQVPARELESHRDKFLQRVPIPGTAHRLGYLLLGMHAEGYPADEITDAATLEVAGLQTRAGSWSSNAHRPPSEHSEFSATALALQTLKLYGPPAMKSRIDQQIVAARRWLLQARPRTHQEHAFRLLGLRWSGAEAAAVEAAATALLALQRDDGGWAQLPWLNADAYATGLSLYALHEGGGVAPTDAPYRRGMSFLLSTQQEDGSWHVRSRSYKFQPFFESGFPHGHDQWISAAGSSWAAMALMLALPPTAASAAPRGRVVRL